MFSLNQLFDKALGIKPPWSIKDVKFDEKKQQLDIYIDFQRGAESIMKMKNQELKELLKHTIQ